MQRHRQLSTLGECAKQEAILFDEPRLANHIEVRHMKLWTHFSPKNGSSARQRYVSKFCLFTFIAAFGLLLPFSLYGNTDYYRHAYFDNSLTSDSYFYSGGQA